MRRKREARRLLAALAGISAVAGAAFALATNASGPRAGAAQEAGEALAAGAARAQVAERGKGLDAEPGAGFRRVAPGTQRALGSMSLRGGGLLRLRAEERENGMTCLVGVEEPSGGPAASCVRGSLFDQHKVFHLLTMEGGPERFTAMRLFGVAAPSVARVVVERSDGSAVEAVLNGERAFLVESAPEELARDVFPSRVRAYGRGGRLLETSEIPAPR